MDKERANDFAQKAEKLLRWSDVYLDEMREHGRHGRVDDVERIFVSLLLFLDSVHQALVDCAKKLDLDKWREELNQIREQDQLLRYLWKARNSEAHDALVKWSPSMQHVDFKIVDAEKTNKIVRGAASQGEAVLRVFCYAYQASDEKDLIERMKQNPIPSKERQQHAGVELLISLRSLSLRSFRIGRGRDAETIDEPTSHFGQQLPPSADQAVLFALRFYKRKLEELRVQMV